ncbi:hypothetical protein, partial [Salmonella sp. s51228]|uniref:hypothetical protein n=1 Tax=Salmonella sp. s51228 TaxID=3159652 RepID=UPI0039806565
LYLIPTHYGKYFLILGPERCPDVSYELITYENHPSEINSRSVSIIEQGQDTIFGIAHSVGTIGLRSLVLLKAKKSDNNINCDCFSYSFSTETLTQLQDQLIGFYVEVV